MFSGFLLLLVGLASQTLAQSQPFGQCGGQGWAGPTTCTSGWTCVFSNAYYSQCLQSATTSAPTSSAPATSTTKTTTTIATTTSSSATGTLTGFPASAPTVPPSNLVGKTPALGWNSWNAYGCNINEAKVLAAANQFVSLGLKAAGYQYINIDDCWAVTARNATSKQIVPDPAKFPNGISGVATQVHALGLKFGIYSDAGTATCAGFPGSLGFEAIDAATFNAWGVDYLKYGTRHNCNVPANWSDSGTPQNGDWYNSNSAIRYRQMTAALAAQPRPVQFNLCLWGNYNVWNWGARVGHSWRLSGDTSPTWSFITSIIPNSVSHSATGFGAHGDMDMMEIGNGALTIQEQRTHFAAWIMLKSPILLGTDLSLLNSTQLAIIKNAELLAFHQDTTVGGPAVPFTPFASAPTTSPAEYYVGKSSKGTHVFIINTSASAATKSFTFSNAGLGSSGTFSVHDMWAGADLPGTYAASASFSVTVQPHDTVAYFINVL
ncbi:glycoside hydrolase [Mycena leptocephala]|nr:glycoside hydrolase [Mycena leptocephala]